MIIKQFRNEFCIAFLLIIISSGMTFVLSFLSAYLFSKHEQLNHFAITLSAFCFLILTSACIQYLSEAFYKRLQLKVRIFKVPHTLHHIFSLPISTLQKYSPTQLSQLTKDYEQSLIKLLNNAIDFLMHAILMLLLAGMIFYFNFFIGALAIIIIFLTVGIRITTYPTLSRLSIDYISMQSKNFSFLNESLAQIHKIKTANQSGVICHKWQQLVLAANRLLDQSYYMEVINWLIEKILFGSFILLVFYYANSPVAIICAIQLITRYESFSTELQNILNARMTLLQLSPILRLEPELISSSNYIDDSHFNIQLKNITFNNLQNISLHIPDKHFVAIIGPSGSGKSTLFKLILGLEKPESGSILINKLNIHELNLQELRKHFGVVLQSTRLFPGTIYSNLCINKKITLEEAWRLAHFVGMDNEISAMPMKMFTHISDNPGDSISGGQRQKILIARALATQPKVLFLDEATSALDNHSQELVMRNLKALDITLVVIAHRLSTIAQSDLIYRLENGRVIIVSKDEVEDGTRRAITAEYRAPSL